MKNEFSIRIKDIEDELTALKTAKEYTSVRSSVESTWRNVTTGSFKIVYDSQGEKIMSYFFAQIRGIHYPNIFAETPQGNSQIVKINTTYYEASSSGYTPITDYADLTIISNVPILSITRIS
jgi:hypothetical protein